MSKGQRYMREVAAQFQDWIGGQWRPRSTLLAPIEGWHAKGDLESSAASPFVIECKKVEGWELDGLMSSWNWTVWAWWEQAVSQACVYLRDGASPQSAIPLLTFARNKRPTLVLGAAATFEWLDTRPGDGPGLTIRAGKRRLGIYRLTDLVRSNPPRAKPKTGWPVEAAGWLADCAIRHPLRN